MHENSLLLFSPAPDIVDSNKCQHDYSCNDICGVYAGAAGGSYLDRNLLVHDKNIISYNISYLSFEEVCLKSSIAVDCKL